MEFLILLVALVAGLFWVKMKYPDAEISKRINSLLSSFNSKNKSSTTESSVPLTRCEEDSNASEVITETTNVVVDSEEVSTLVEPEAISGDVQEEPEVLPEIIATPVVVAVTTSLEVNTAIPEDSVLKRHYLARLAAERQEITNPYPTDSVLRRHYESMNTFSS